MKITDLKINNSSIGKDTKLVAIKPVNEYVNGQRTDNVTAYKYTIVLPDCGYERLDVKIEGALQIENANDNPDVSFDGLELFIFWFNGQYSVGAKANSIHILKKG